MKKIATIILMIILLAMVGCKNDDYKKAVSLFEYERYDEAQSIFEELGDYKDSRDYVKKCNYVKAQVLFTNEKYEEAQNAFEKLGDFQDSKEQISNCKVKICETLIRKIGYFDTYYQPSWSSIGAAQEAQSYYNTLSESEKEKVSNKGSLPTSVEIQQAVELRQKKDAEETIEKAVLGEAVKEVKKYLKNPSSYQERTDKQSRTYVLWDEKDPTKVSGVVYIYYSALNDYGGRRDSEANSYWEGTYINGKFTLTKINIGLYMMVH